MVCANRVALFYITRRGRTLAERIARHYPGAACARLSGLALETHWVKGARLIFIMAAGIVVRKIAPLLKDKRTDPAAVVLDEHGEHVVSLLSGHLGGANALAKEVASSYTAHRSSPPPLIQAAFLPSTSGPDSRALRSKIGSSFHGWRHGSSIEAVSDSTRISPWMRPRHCSGRKRLRRQTW